MTGGFGQVGFGRSEFGQAGSEVEPRFYSSDPSDAGSGVSIYKEVLEFSLYCFSSRVQDESVLIEVSEAGGEWTPAYQDGSFVAPYDGEHSWTDVHQSSPQEFIARLHKTDIPWVNDAEIRIRVTAYDEYNHEATKSVVNVWDSTD